MKKYKRFLLILTVTVFIFCSIYYFISYRNTEPTDELVWIRNSLVKKHENVDMEKSKIIITGGSSTLFGMRTKDISEQLKIPAYNLAVHAGLGLDFILDDAKKTLKSGDVVILPLEYNHFSSNEETTKLAYDYYKAFGGENISTIITIDSLKSVFQVKPYENAKFVIKSLIDQKEVTENPLGYNSKNLNDHGDQTMHFGIRETELVRAGPFGIPNEFTETLGLKMLKDFNSWCIDNNVKLFVTYPNTLYFDVYDNKDYKEYFTFLEEYFTENNISTIGKPSDFFYDKKYFFDTMYHLNEEGMTVRTQEFISLIEKFPEIQSLQSNGNKTVYSQKTS